MIYVKILKFSFSVYYLSWKFRSCQQVIGGFLGKKKTIKWHVRFFCSNLGNVADVEGPFTILVRSFLTGTWLPRATNAFPFEIFSLSRFLYEEILCFSLKMASMGIGVSLSMTSGIVGGGRDNVDRVSMAAPTTLKLNQNNSQRSESTCRFWGLKTHRSSGAIRAVSKAVEENTSRNLRVGLICGGPSAERGISLNSARSVLDHIQVL